MRGFCFLGEPEGEAQKRHLKIILTEPNSAGQVVVVTVTSLKGTEGQPPECVLHAGDHPFIRHDSFINFGKATAKKAISLVQSLSSGDLIRKEELEPAVFERVLQAAKASREMHRRIKSMLFSAL